MISLITIPKRKNFIISELLSFGKDVKITKVGNKYQYLEIYFSDFKNRSVQRRDIRLYKIRREIAQKTLQFFNSFHFSFHRRSNIQKRIRSTDIPTIPARESGITKA